MSKGGKQTTTTVTAVDPGVMQKANDGYGRALAIADTPVTPYGGILNFSAPTQSAQGLLGYYAPDVGTASYAAQTGSASTYDPSNILRSNVRDVGAGSVGADQIAQFMNPYTQQVIDATGADLERSRQLAQLNNNARWGAATAFGNGSRRAVANAVTDGEYDRNASMTFSNLRLNGFNSALTAAQAEAARSLQAQLANQGVDVTIEQANALAQNQASQFNASQRQSADYANLGFINNAGQFNASQAQQAALANQQASLSSAGVRSGAASQLASLEQARYAADYAEFMRQQQDAMTKQGLLNSTFGTLPVPQTSSATSKSTPGLFDYWKAGLDAAAAVTGPK